MAANFVPCSTKTVSQNQPLETAASKPVESPKSVSGDSLPTREIARNRAISRVSQESKLETGLVGWGGRIRTSVFWIRPFSQIGHQRLLAHELQTSETQRRSAFGWDRACRSHGHRPRQGAALFVGRAGEQHWVPRNKSLSRSGASRSVRADRPAAQDHSMIWSARNQQ